MDGWIRHRHQQAYTSQPFWLRPYWWLWTGSCGLLILVLSLGAPLLCIVHCALLDVAQMHMPDMYGAATTIKLPCMVSAPLPADQHIPLQAIFPAILVTGVGIALWPIRHGSPEREPLRLQPWVAPPPVPPPRLYS